MKTASAVILCTVAAIMGTFSLLFHDKLLHVLTFVLLLSLALIFRKFRLWWPPTLFFGLLGIGHLVALWALYPQAHAAGAVPAFETFGPGYLLMATFFFARERWFGKAHS